MNQTRATLESECHRLEGRGYPALKDLRGAYAFDGFTLYIDHVQGDPFAAPSKLRVRVPMEVAGFPAELIEGPVRRLALADFVARAIRSAIGKSAAEAGTRSEGSGKSGLIRIDAGGQEVLERTAVRISRDGDWIEARLEVGLPAAGRRILGKRAGELLCDAVPRASLMGLRFDSLDADRVTAFVHCIENQEAIREALAGRGLIAFVGNGAILPRESGANDRPLQGADVVPFESPPEFEVCIDVPNQVNSRISSAGSHQWVGMGIPKGVNLIVGGGYHGKSTLLQALERCVYPHIPGDGRETVVADRGLVKIRAEDGRRIERVDIHAFIDQLPGDRSTRAFCSDDASGSTSQAASIVEAIEAGCSGLLLDEDTCATNFMVRDARMQELVHKRYEPITPYVDRVRDLHDVLGISTVLVMGGSGDYFEAADRVIMLRDYKVHDATAAAKQIAQANPGKRQREGRGAIESPPPRIPISQSFDASRGKKGVKIEAREPNVIRYGRCDLDLRGVAQLVDTSQARAAGLSIHWASKHAMKNGATLTVILDELDALLDREGLEALDPYGSGEHHPGNLARPRRHEIAAAINRLRSLRME